MDGGSTNSAATHRVVRRVGRPKGLYCSVLTTYTPTRGAYCEVRAVMSRISGDPYRMNLPRTLSVEPIPVEPFEQEWCDRHGPTLQKAHLVPSFRPDLPIISYRWRCPKCSVGWVTEGSPSPVSLGRLPIGVACVPI